MERSGSTTNHGLGEGPRRAVDQTGELRNQESQTEGIKIIKERKNMENNNDYLDKNKKDNEITKEEFKNLYFRYGIPGSGWTLEYWNIFYEKETGKRYYFDEPRSPESTQMYIDSGDNGHRIFLLSEESSESFHDYPGKY